uniref:Uncharacterized protein n=1 Tax=Octopus bimaculoides TaxID=37653 RepID=A0A0L8HYQ7_OCTBM
MLHRMAFAYSSCQLKEGTIKRNQGAAAKSKNHHHRWLLRRELLLQSGGDIHIYLYNETLHQINRHISLQKQNHTRMASTRVDSGNY